MKYLENCQPAEVFEYFEEICQIPHESGNTAKIAAYLVSFAEKHGLDHYMDDFNNVIIRIAITLYATLFPKFLLRKHSLTNITARTSK